MSEQSGDRAALVDLPVRQEDSAVEAVETVPQAGSEPLARPANWWERLLARFRRTGDDGHQLRALDDAIALHPDVVVNYVLRGEVYLKRGEYDLAASDFRRARTLAEEQVETNNWGIIAQAMHDRAGVGLRRAERHTAGRPAYEPVRQPNRLLDEDVIEKPYGHSTETTSED